MFPTSGPHVSHQKATCIPLGAPQGENVSSQMVPDASFPLENLGTGSREMNLWLKCFLHMHVQIPAST